MKERLVSVGSKWKESSADRFVVVNEIVSEDNELKIKYHMVGHDTLYALEFMDFFNKFISVVE